MLFILQVSILSEQLYSSQKDEHKPSSVTLFLGFERVKLGKPGTLQEGLTPVSHDSI